MLDSIAVSTASRPATAMHSAAETCDEMIRGQIPNLFRLYLNPYVAQTCFCLGRAIHEAWHGASDSQQVFLANSFEEALGGAVKLARYDRSKLGLATGGIVLDDAGRLEHFAYSDLTRRARLTYVPGIEVVSNPTTAFGHLLARRPRPGFVVVSATALQAADTATLRQWSESATQIDRPLLIVYVDREQLFSQGANDETPWRNAVPDIVVCDESFVDNAVPLGAFAAPKKLFARWNRRGMATFHSTTYQPNTISTLHFMNCLRRNHAEFVRRHAETLTDVEHDLDCRRRHFRRCYNPSLGKLIDKVALDQSSIRAVGHYIEHSGKRLFDGVAGVACSVRGHNPESFVTEIAQTGSFVECRDELERRLHDLTGLANMLPAVSGASAVEQALKLGLVAQFPRDHVLALQGGYGGKTLFALTGTAKSSLKAGIGPLYPNVSYVDPFASDAVTQIEELCRTRPIGVMQVELVQGVGGVRAVPAEVLECLGRMRECHGSLLLVDEVQTGVNRTGPFVRSTSSGVCPDLLTIGKGVSDMMFPFALTLYNDAVRDRIEQAGCTLPHRIEQRYGYELGYRTALAMLRRADETNLEARVNVASEQFAEALARELRGCRNVGEVRCFGLLIGIELETRRLPRRALKKLLLQLSVLAMMNHHSFPVVVGFCQYEPNVLKLTPPLSITADEIRDVAATIGAVLRMSPWRLATAALWNQVRRSYLGRPQKTNGAVAQ